MTIHQLPERKSAEWYMAKHSAMRVYQRFLRLDLIEVNRRAA